MELPLQEAGGAARPRQERRARTLLAYRVRSKAFFVYGYAKNERDNIDERELKTLKRLAAVMLSWDDAMLKQALAMGKLSEVINDD